MLISTFSFLVAASVSISVYGVAAIHNENVAVDWLSAASPSTVHFVSSCHFDVGFADTAANIVNRYFDKYYAASINTSQVLRQRGGEERLVFLTHTYLVSLYLDCPPGMGIHCPDQEAKDQFLAAIKRGDIVWHAMPFNSELELLDASMIDFSIQLTHDLDAKLGRSNTITMSQRDVPGTTRSIIPLLKKRGVQAITVGVNPGSMPPAVPSIFRWLDPISNESIIAMWHPDGYGGMSCCKPSDSVVVSGSPSALMYGVRIDNTGPPPLQEVISDFAKIRKIFPGSKVVATDYDAFVNSILPYTSNLPVYEQEIGDTWLYGVPSDHYKTAAARVMMTARTECLISGRCNISDYRVYNFSRLLIKASEHTWGLAYTSFLKDNVNFLNPKFHAVQYNKNYVTVANAWREQRDWGIHFALDALADHPLAEELRPQLAEIRNVPTPSTKGYTRVESLADVFTVGSVKLRFSIAPFSIAYLSVAGVEYASQSTSTNMGSLLYQSFTAEDFDVFMSHYLYVLPIKGWDGAFGKPGLKNVSGVEHQEIYASLVAVWKQGTSDTSSTFLLQLSFPPSLTENYGAPQDTWVQLIVSDTALDMQVILLNKTATRLPESIFFRFKPLVKKASTMVMDKVGEVFSVLDVGKNGSKHTHAVGYGGIQYTSNPGLKFLSKHVPVTCIGKPTPFPTPMESPDVLEGFSFNIVNNIWGTNYVMWYPFDEGDGSFRSDFRVEFPHAG